MHPVSELKRKDAAGSEALNPLVGSIGTITTLCGHPSFLPARIGRSLLHSAETVDKLWDNNCRTHDQSSTCGLVGG